MQQGLDADSVTGDIYDQAAAEMAAALRAEPPEVQEAYRYLFALVAEDAGLLRLIGHELRNSGQRLVYQQVDGDAVYAVDRPKEWSAEEEAYYVGEMKRQLLGASEGKP